MFSIAALFLCLVALGCATKTPPPDRIAIEGQQFITTATRQSFHPWGSNYDRDHRMRLIEDYWQTEWPTVVKHFRDMKALGANLVRIHLQFNRFMEAPDRPNAQSLAQLERLLDLAQETGVYLDITGLACYRRSDVPPWFANLGEQERWQAQANFWSAIANTCANHPALFCYDLINEPAVPNQRKSDWLTGDLAGFTYCQFIVLDPAGRDRAQIAHDWIDKMTQAIRQHDPHTPITVGLLPFAKGTGFDLPRLADHLDFISVHLYPTKGKIDQDIENLRRFVTPKPLVVEEIFPLNCGIDGLQDFILKSQPVCAGHLGFYWGQTPEELEKTGKPGDALTAQALRFFQRQDPSIRNPKPAIGKP
jgi:hypothetical protein